jgi:STE24 endopeptidase
MLQASVSVHGSANAFRNHVSRLAVRSAERHTLPLGIEELTIQVSREFVLRKLARSAVFCLLVAAGIGVAAASPQADARSALMQAPNTAPQENHIAPSAAPESSPMLHVTAYTLPPDKYAKARHLARIGYVAGILVPLYSLLIFYLLLRWGWSVKFRDWAEAVSSWRIVQAAIYTAAFNSVVALLNLPIGMWFHWLYRENDLVIQGWGSWFGDRGKMLLIGTVIATILVFAGASIIRRSPRRCWLYFWLGSIPFLIFIIFLTPLVIDPLFNKFEPLAEHDPQLVNDLERVVHRAGLDIPPQRMFLMKASEKVKFVNAYVTGLGASKRVVVWDTTIAKMTRPQILYVFGHEMGHYVLNHIYKGLIVAAFGLLVCFFLTARISRRWLERHSAAWKIRGPADWAALPVYAIPILLLTFVSTPISNAYSRYDEHQADQYGLEVTHGLTSDSGQIAAQSFQILGEIDLEDPAPNRLEILWYWDHPWIGDRIQFALHYDPWSKGESGEFVK